MSVPASCNATRIVGLMDYAYLTTNVYHDPSQDPLLGKSPYVVNTMSRLIRSVGSDRRGWHEIQFSQVCLPKKHGMYAELYVKIYNKKIQ